MKRVLCVALIAACLAAAPARAPGPHASYVTVVVMENKDAGRIAGNPDAPYFNALIARGAVLADDRAVAHPSEPNYLALFSGSTQGVTNDHCPLEFSKANVASELIAAGRTFGAYSEAMPSDGFTGCFAGRYARKHSPWANFTNVPASTDHVYHGFPAAPPNLTWITPDLCNDMHDCPVRDGDAWLARNLPPILAWNAKHDGVLIVTFDEAQPDWNGKNQVATVLVGATVKPGTVDRQTLTHYSILHTIETIFGIACIDRDCSAPLVGGIWK